MESAFGREVQSRAQQLLQKNAWKSQGTGAKFAGRGMLWGQDGTDAPGVSVAHVGLGRGKSPNQLVYTLTADRVVGLFTYDTASKQEQRHLLPRLPATAAFPGSSSPAARSGVLHGATLRWERQHRAVLVRKRWASARSRKAYSVDTDLGVGSLVPAESSCFNPPGSVVDLPGSTSASVPLPFRNWTQTPARSRRCKKTNSSTTFHRFPWPDGSFICIRRPYGVFPKKAPRSWGPWVTHSFSRFASATRSTSIWISSP